MSDELKPVRCGCGGKAEIIKHPNGKYTVSCTRGGCMANVGWCPDEKTAIEAWNKARSANDIEIKERTARVERIDTTSKTSVVYKCLNCGQYTHRTSYSSPVNFCTNCGCRLEW